MSSFLSCEDCHKPFNKTHKPVACECGKLVHRSCIQSRNHKSAPPCIAAKKAVRKSNGSDKSFSVDQTDCSARVSQGKRQLPSPTPSDQPVKLARGVAPPTPNSQLATPSGSMALASVPEWALALKSSIDGMNNTLNVMNKKIDNIDESIAGIRTDIADLSTRVVDLETTMGEFKRAVSEEFVSRDSKLDSLKNQLVNSDLLQMDLDSCEILITGVPVVSTLTDEMAIARVLDKLDLTVLLSTIRSVRAWTGRRKGDSETRGSFTRGIVIRLASVQDRDLVISSSSKLAKLTCNDVFGCGEKNKVFVSPLWPKNTYKLWRAALEKSKSLNYARPLIRNMKVFMRATAEGPFTCVRSIDDLNLLEPRPKTA